jgi:chromate transporter
VRVAIRELIGYYLISGLAPVTAIVYGVSPAVIALFLHSCYRLTKLGMEDWLQWVIVIVAFAITVAVQAEVALLFIEAGLVGMLYYGSLLRGRLSSSIPMLAAVPLAAGVTSEGLGSMLGKLLMFFLKAGSLTFGSGLVIVPFLEKGCFSKPAGWISANSWSRWPSA